MPNTATLRRKGNHGLQAIVLRRFISFAHLGVLYVSAAFWRGISERIAISTNAASTASRAIIVVLEWI